MIIPHKTFKMLVHGTALSLSIANIMYHLVQLASNTLTVILMVIFSIYVDFVAQWIRGISKVNRKKRPGFSFFLDCCYGFYIIVFAMSSAIGYFMCEVDLMESKAAQVHIEQTDIRDEIKQINESLDAYNLQLKTEATTGYGYRSQGITKAMDELRQKKEELQKTLKATSENLEKAPKNFYKSLSKAYFNIPENILKLIIFFGIELMIYLGLILTPWDVPSEEEVEQKERITNEAKEEKYKNSKEELIAVVHALFENKNPKRLNGFEEILKLTGLPRWKCEKYRDFLNNLIINNQNAIHISKGTIKANHTKNTILSFIEQEVKEESIAA